jgi:hypothetical protein
MTCETYLQRLDAELQNKYENINLQLTLILDILSTKLEAQLPCRTTQ